jgi:hypothetical protein
LSDFNRQINEERDRLQREKAHKDAWDSSAFSIYDPQVGRPSGRLAALVSEVLPAIPNNLWQIGFVGQDPNGSTRVTGAPYLGGTEEYPSESPLRLWLWKRPTGLRSLGYSPPGHNMKVL